MNIDAKNGTGPWKMNSDSYVRALMINDQVDGGELNLLDLAGLMLTFFTTVST
jgi:hypothetical protein